jgi:hypothetical protein
MGDEQAALKIAVSEAGRLLVMVILRGPVYNGEFDPGSG